MFINVNMVMLISQNPSWFSFEDAKQHIYKLMKNDSYVRFLRSDDYSSVLRIALSVQASRLTHGKAPLTMQIIQSENPSNGGTGSNPTNQFHSD